jgi:hypothetical protein
MAIHFSKQRREPHVEEQCWEVSGTNFVTSKIQAKVFGLSVDGCRELWRDLVSGKWQLSLELQRKRTGCGKTLCLLYDLSRQ